MQNKITAYIKMLLLSAGVYIVIDFPMRFTGFIGLSGFAGIKNFLPITVGLMFGPLGTAGLCIGAAVSNLVFAATLKEAVCEIAGVLIMGCGAWLLWYTKNSRPVALKTGRDYARFGIIAVALSVLCTLPMLFLLGSSAWVEALICYLLFSVLVGVPVLILETSVLWVKIIMPKGQKRTPDIEYELRPNAEGIDAGNEKIEDYCMLHKIPLKQAFAIENCAEEVVLRIQENRKDTDIRISMCIKDNVSMNIDYTGEKYNPLRKSKDETEDTMLGLSLIRQRALRASYSYTGSVNSLHIVI